MKILLLLLLLLVVLMARTETTSSSPIIAKPNCADRCGDGDVPVPYPFGIGNPSCAKNESFLLNCNLNTNALFFSDGTRISDISYEDGTITANFNYAYKCNSERRKDSANQSINVRDWGEPFTISPTHNKFTALGCNTVALMFDKQNTTAGTFGGCLALCNELSDIKYGASCDGGMGCCQTSIPPNLKRIDTIAANAFKNRTEIIDFNPCNFAFVADISFDISKINISDYPKDNPIIPSPPVVLEWVIGERNCKADERYSCGANAIANCSDTGNGYRCHCKPGFRGNPYLPQGCADINECIERTHRCRPGTCHNTIGNYTCGCPVGMRSDGNFGCKGTRLETIAIVIGGVVLVAIITFLTFILFQKRKKEKYFKENGGLILKHQRIRIFKEEELVMATNNYDSSRFLGEGGFGSVYKGVLPDKTLVAVKKAKGMDKARVNLEFQQEMGIVSQVNHKNVVKILGLCLETKFPLLVYEFISNGTLYHHFHDKRSSVLNSWKNRFKIAVETALALDYLHSIADPPIIHGDVKSMNILLDDHYTSKVSDFGASVLLSPNYQTGIGVKVQGTFGYLDPEYLMTGNLTDKSDVYSFGVVMVELLSGEKPTSGSRNSEKRNIIQYFISSVEDDQIPQTLNFEPVDDGEMEEVAAVAQLVKRCLNGSGLRRPTMKEVVEELARLKKLSDNFYVQHEIDANECLLGQSLYPSTEFFSTQVDEMETNVFIQQLNIE